MAIYGHARIKINNFCEVLFSDHAALLNEICPF